MKKLLLVLMLLNPSLYGSEQKEVLGKDLEGLENESVEVIFDETQVKMISCDQGHYSIRGVTGLVGTPYISSNRTKPLTFRYWGGEYYPPNNNDLHCEKLGQIYRDVVLYGFIDVKINFTGKMYQGELIKEGGCSFGFCWPSSVYEEYRGLLSIEIKGMLFSTGSEQFFAKKKQ